MCIAIQKMVKICLVEGVFVASVAISCVEVVESEAAVQVIVVVVVVVAVVVSV